MQKRSFTLIEILISIVLMVIIILFLYQALDITQKSNEFFTNKLSKQENKTKIKKVLFSDIIYSESNNTQLIEDKNKNTILQMKSSNTYHDSFFL